MASCLKICRGDLRWTVQVQKQVNTKTTGGGYTTTWEDAFKIRCMIKQSGGSRPVIIDGLPVARAPVRFTCSYRQELDPGEDANTAGPDYPPDRPQQFRLFFRNQYYKINYIEDIEYKRMYLEIGTEYGTPQPTE